jgi:hypothetical protein
LLPETTGLINININAENVKRNTVKVKRGNTLANNIKKYIAKPKNPNLTEEHIKKANTTERGSKNIGILTDTKITQKNTNRAKQEKQITSAEQNDITPNIQKKNVPEMP